MTDIILLGSGGCVVVKALGLWSKESRVGTGLAFDFRD